MSPGAGWRPPEGAVPLRRIRELRAGATSTRCRLRGKVPGTGLYCPFSWNGVSRDVYDPRRVRLPGLLSGETTPLSPLTALERSQAGPKTVSPSRSDALV